MEEKDSEDESDFIGFSPIKDKVTSESDIEQANSLAKQLHVYKPGIQFVPGAKLEVLDARDNKWYLCKVVEVDWGELDILVHYERWSVRFDEWLKMDSTRIRPICLATQRRENKKLFRIGERVLAFWAPDSKMYPAQITRQISEDFWNVLFFDGFTKTLRTNQIKKAGRKSPEIDPLRSARPFSRSSSHPVSNISEEEEPLASPSLSDQHKRNIFSVEILKEKRKTTRKPDVEELFQSLKKRKRSDTISDGEDEPIILKDKPAKKKCTKWPQEKDPPPPKYQLKVPRNTTPPPKEILEVNFKAESEDLSLHLKSEPPKGVSYFEVDLKDGWKKICSRRCSIYTSAKWDIHYLSPDQKKLKTLQDITKHLMDHPDVSFDPLQTDFSVKTAWVEYEKQKEKSQDCQIVSPNERKKSSFVLKSEEEDELPQKNYIDLSLVKIEEEEVEEDAKSHMEVKIKKEEEKEEVTPASIKKEPESDEKGKKTPLFQETESEECVKLSDLLTCKEESPTAKEPQKGYSRNAKVHKRGPLLGELPPSSSPMEAKKSSASTGVVTPRTRMRAAVTRRDSSITSEVLNAADATHLCPKKGCGKSFRKESLLQMHMKHYHPGLLKRKSLHAPNVADLAYARTVGDHLDAEPSSGSSSLGFSPGSYSPEKLSKTSDKKLSKSFLGFESKKYSRDSKKEVNLDLSISDLEEDDLASEFDVEEDEEEPDDSSSEGKDKVPPESVDPDYVPVCAQKERRPGRVEEKIKRKARKCEDTEEDLGEGWNEPCDTENEDDAIINCRCGSKEEDGLMLQCDVCLCWQHSSCYNIDNETQVPEKYICSLCENPRGQRSSMKFRHHQEWLKEGKLPRFSFSGTDNDPKLEASIRKGHELTANILQLSPLIHSLRLKLRISKNEDHPKFVMWFKKWMQVKDEFDKEEKETLDPPAVSDLISAFQQPPTLQADPTQHPMMDPSPQTYPQSQQPIQATDDASLGKAVPLETSSPLPIQESFSSQPVEPDLKPAAEEGSDKELQQATEGDCVGKADQLDKPSEDVKAKEHSELVETTEAAGPEPSKSKQDKDGSMGEMKSSTVATEEPEKMKSEMGGSFVPEEMPSVESKYPQADSTRVPLDDPAIDLEFDEDFLSTQTELEQFVKHASSLAPLDNPPTTAPIIPETERIEPLKCKLNLLEHIECFQDKIFNRFDYIEKQIQALESEMGLTSRFSKEEEELFSSQSEDLRDPVTLQARSLVKLVLKDLEAVHRMTEYTAP